MTRPQSRRPSRAGPGLVVGPLSTLPRRVPRLRPPSLEVPLRDLPLSSTTPADRPQVRDPSPRRGRRAPLYVVGEGRNVPRGRRRGVWGWGPTTGGSSPDVRRTPSVHLEPVHKKVGSRLSPPPLSLRHRLGPPPDHIPDLSGSPLDPRPRRTDSGVRPSTGRDAE